MLGIRVVRERDGDIADSGVVNLLTCPTYRYGMLIIPIFRSGMYRVKVHQSVRKHHGERYARKSLHWACRSQVDQELAEFREWQLRRGRGPGRRRDRCS